MYNTGINNKVMIVANNKPIIIDIASGSHIIPPPKYKGSNPNEVVNVVRMIWPKSGV